MRIFLFMLLLLGGVSTSAQNETIHIWNEMKDKGASTYDSTTEKGVIRITKVECPTLEVFTPSSSNNGKAVVVCPGGGYNLLAYDKEGTEIAQWLNTLGYTAYVLAYRVPNNKNEALLDAQRAIRIVRSRHKDAQIGIIGFSAGASLSARTATRFNEELYTESKKLAGISTRPDFAILIYPAYLDEGENHTLTLELSLSAETPPMFIFSAADDYYANSALVMAQALRFNNTPVELHLYPTGGHGYGMRTDIGKVWPQLVEKWLKKLGE